MIPSFLTRATGNVILPLRWRRLWMDQLLGGDKEFGFRSFGCVKWRVRSGLKIEIRESSKYIGGITYMTIREITEERIWVEKKGRARTWVSPGHCNGKMLGEGGVSKEEVTGEAGRKPSECGDPEAKQGKCTGRWRETGWFQYCWGIKEDEEWEFITGFGNVVVSGDLDKSSFGVVTEVKTLFEWI